MILVKLGTHILEGDSVIWNLIQQRYFNVRSGIGVTGSAQRAATITPTVHFTVINFGETRSSRLQGA